MKKNSVTVTTPSEKNIAKLVQDIAHVKEGLDQFVIQQTTIEKKHSPRPRRGGESIGELIAQIAEKRKLVLPSASPGEIVAQRARATRLRPLKSAAAALARSVNDAVFAAESKAWATTTDLYSMLTTMAKRDETLKTELAPATEFFSLGKRKAKAPPDQPPAQPPAPAPAR